MEETPLVETSPEKPKKNPALVLTIVNIVLFIGLIILVFLILKPNNSIPAKAIMKASSGNTTIAYVNTDTILAHYDLVKNMKDQLQSSTDKLEKELKNKQASFEKDAAYFQEQVNKKAISESSAQEIYASLMQEQQKLVELRDKYSSDLAEQEFKMNQLLLDSLDNFLKRYNRKMNFDYIFSYNKGGSILIANDTLDITREVLDLLNAEYKQKND